MSGLANTPYRLEDGSLVTVFAGVDPRALEKQIEKDIYDSGFFAGVLSERESILKLLNSKRDTGSHDAENDFINAFIDDLAALIEGSN